MPKKIRCLVILLSLLGFALSVAQDTKGGGFAQATSKGKLLESRDANQGPVSGRKQPSSPPVPQAHKPSAQKANPPVAEKRPSADRKVKVLSHDLPPADTGRVLARIGGKTILVDEFIRRAEYTIRPLYCKGNGGIEKKIVLNSLLAEKMLALEAGNDNELTRNKHFQHMLQGRKEQLMREVLYYAEGTAAVKLDTAEIMQQFKIAGRTYHLEYFDVPNDSDAAAVKQILDTSGTSFADVYRVLAGRDSLPQRDVSWSSRESKVIHKALFKDLPKVNQIVGPMRVNDKSHLFMRVRGWTDREAITEKQSAERWNDVTEELSHEKADAHYDKFIARMMDGKTLQFEPTAFRKFVEIVAPLYLAPKKEKEEALLDEAFHRQPQENPKFDDVERNLDALRGAPLFTIEDKVWTVEDVTREMERHPLVFRYKSLHKKNFSEQLKLAVVDMVRDRYLTNEAYQRGYDKYPTVGHYTEMWQDAILSLWQKYAHLRSIGVAENGQIDLITKYLNPYVDSLRRKYDNRTEINVDELNKIKLTQIDMFVLQNNVPFAVFVPTFPQLTTHKWLDYGRKMNSGKQEEPAQKNTSEISRSRPQR